MGCQQLTETQAGQSLSHSSGPQALSSLTAPGSRTTGIRQLMCLVHHSQATADLISRQNQLANLLDYRYEMR